MLTVLHERFRFPKLKAPLFEHTVLCMRRGHLALCVALSELCLGEPLQHRDTLPPVVAVIIYPVSRTRESHVFRSRQATVAGQADS